MIKRVYVEYDKYRDNYLPGCEVTKLFCLAKKSTKLKDEDLEYLHHMGFEAKILFDLPAIYFKEAKEEVNYPTMTIKRQDLGYIGYHFNAKGRNCGEPQIGNSLNEVFMKLMRDPKKKEHNNSGVTNT